MKDAQPQTCIQEICRVPPGRARGGMSQARIHMLQTSFCLQIIVLLAVSSIAQYEGQIKASPQPSHGRDIVPAARERRKNSKPSIPVALAASLGRAEGMQHNHALPCPALALPQCNMPPLHRTQRVPSLLTGQAGQRAQVQLKQHQANLSDIKSLI